MARPPTGQVLARKTRHGRTYALRFRAYGKRHYLTLGSSADGYTRHRAEDELANVLADVRRGLWKPPAAELSQQASTDEPTFHVLASEWVERRRHEVDPRTVEHWRWALSNHLLPFFADCQPSQITAAFVERFKAAKLAEREERLADLERWHREKPERRGPMPPRPLGNASVNKNLKVLAQVLDDAVELGYAETNVARGARRRLKASKPKRTWLELHEVQALLSAAGSHRALIATMILAGLRVGELCSLRSSLLYEAGASPAYVMSQMGHSDPALALEVYTKVMERKRDTGARMDALIRGADWAPMGTTTNSATEPMPERATEKPLFAAAS